MSSLLAWAKTITSKQSFQQSVEEALKDMDHKIASKHLEMIAASHDYQKLVDQREYLESLLPPSSNA